jgi:hypothetical protein
VLEGFLWAEIHELWAWMETLGRRESWMVCRCHQCRPASDEEGS